MEKHPVISYIDKMPLTSGSLYRIIGEAVGEVWNMSDPIGIVERDILNVRSIIINEITDIGFNFKEAD